MPKPWEDYLLSILFVIVFPVMPILIERWHTGAVQGPSLWLTAAIYSVSIAVLSSSRLIFGCAIIASLLAATKYGYEIHVMQRGGSPDEGVIPVGMIVLVAFLHAAERYNLHVVDRRPFLQF